MSKSDPPMQPAAIIDEAPKVITGRPTLEALGTKFGTDKSSRHHGYLNFYERFLSDARAEPITLLEIGVFQGGSVRMWEEYFPNGRIIGVDINPSARKFASDRITIEIADQSSVADLTMLARRYGRFDIVVDDGSHMWNHQITTLQYLYPFLKEGGIFVVEDLDTSFGGYAASYRGNATISAFDYLRRLAELVVADKQIPIGNEEDSFLRTYAPRTEFVAFHRHTAVLRRRAAETPVGAGVPTHGIARLHSPPPLVAAPPAPADAPRGSLLVHLGNVGDSLNANALVGGERASKNTIQGFMLDVPDLEAGLLQYRALFAAGDATPWLAPGTFAGSRGRSTTIRGFAVRLGGVLGERLDCVYVGAFAGHDGLVQCANGEMCRAPNNGAMEAMQIYFRPRVDAAGPGTQTG